MENFKVNSKLLNVKTPCVKVKKGRRTVETRDFYLDSVPTGSSLKFQSLVKKFQ